MKEVTRWIRIQRNENGFDIDKYSFGFKEVLEQLEKGSASSRIILLELVDVEAQAAFQAVEHMRTQDRGEQAQLGLILLSAFLAQAFGFVSSSSDRRAVPLANKQAGDVPRRSGPEPSGKKEQSLITKPQENCLLALLLSKKRLSSERAEAWLKQTCNVSNVQDIGRREASNLIQKLNKL